MCAEGPLPFRAVAQRLKLGGIMLTIRISPLGGMTEEMEGDGDTARIQEAIAGAAGRWFWRKGCMCQGRCG